MTPFGRQSGPALSSAERREVSAATGSDVGGWRQGECVGCVSCCSALHSRSAPRLGLRPPVPDAHSALFSLRLPPPPQPLHCCTRPLHSVAHSHSLTAAAFHTHTHHPHSHLQSRWIANLRAATRSPCSSMHPPPMSSSSTMCVADYSAQRGAERNALRSAGRSAWRGRTVQWTHCDAVLIGLGRPRTAACAAAAAAAPRCEFHRFLRLR